MSRSAEEAQALEERIQRMKLNSQRIQQRYLEVEEDKKYAAQQNALVQVVQPPGNDWLIRNRKDEFDYPDDRSPPPPISEVFGEGRGRGRGRGRGQPRRWSNEHDDRADRVEDFPRPRRSAPGFEQRPGRERWAPKTSPNAPVNAGNMVIGNWEDPATESRRPPRRSNQSVIPSKVYNNTSLEGPPHKAKYRLAEGDGPPPDPSYSFLGDSMRDGNRASDRRKENNRGMHRSDRPPGSGRMIGNQSNQGHQGTRRPPMPQQSYDEWRRERDAIDQRRINRQKTSDGHWSREWDNDKIVQNDTSPPRYSSTDSWGNSRRRYNNRFGDFLDDSFQKRPRMRSNQSQLNTSGSSDCKSPEKESAFHDRRNFKGRRSTENNFNKSLYDSPPHDNRRSPAVTMSKPMSPPERLEAARRATGPVASSLRQYDTDVCTVTMPSSSLKEANCGAATSPDKNNEVLSPTLKVSVRTDESGKRTRIVEGVGCPNLTPQLGTRDSRKNSEVGSGKKRRQRMVKTRKKHVSQSSQSKDDDSWEDLSSEDDVSFVADLPGPSKTPLETQHSSKSQDVSSGPESLDPIPAASKEEELLWEEFHPAGFQNNMTLAMVTETAYKALLSKGETEEKDQQSESNVTDGSEEVSTKLDPILVVTQVVKEEVDCMSLTSVTTDSSLPEDINVVPSKSGAKSAGDVDAEELSGPVSILEIPVQNGDGPTDTGGSFQSANSPKKLVEGEAKNDGNCCRVETFNVDAAKGIDEGNMNSGNAVVDTECSNDGFGKKKIEVGSGVRSDDELAERLVNEDSCSDIRGEEVEFKKSEGLEGSVKDGEQTLNDDGRCEDVRDKGEVDEVGELDKLEDVKEPVNDSERPVNEGCCEDVPGKEEEEVKESVKDSEDLKPAESNSGCEKQEIVTEGEKSETFNGVCSSKDSEAICDPGNNCESVPSSDSDKIDGRGTSTLAGGQECRGASNPVDKTMSDNREKSLEITESGASSSR